MLKSLLSNGKETEGFNEFKKKEKKGIWAIIAFQANNDAIPNKPKHKDI